MLLHVQITTPLFTITVPKYIYPSVKCQAESFRTGSTCYLTCACYNSDTHEGGGGGGGGGGWDGGGDGGVMAG